MYIYCITNTLNGKQYIGKCVKEVNKSKNYYGSGLQIKLAIKKYGKENFIKEIKGKAKTAGNYIWKFCEVIK